VLARLAAQDAQAAIANLGGRQAAVAYLHDVDGFTTAEIAEMLSLSPNTIGTYLKRRVKPLRARLEHWADTAKVLALAAMCGVGVYSAGWALDRLGARLPDLPVDPHLRYLVLAALASLATVYRLQLAEAVQAAWKWLTHRRRAVAKRRAHASAAAAARLATRTRRRPRRHL